MKFILCVALAVMCGAAGAAVNKCVDQEGRVLFTDAECPQGETQERPLVPAPVQAPPVAQRSRWADLPHPLVRKTTSIDASTLQAAHQLMLSQDELRKSRRLLTAR